MASSNTALAAEACADPTCSKNLTVEVKFYPGRTFTANNKTGYIDCDNTPIGDLILNTLNKSVAGKTFVAGDSVTLPVISGSPFTYAVQRSGTQGLTITANNKVTITTPTEGSVFEIYIIPNIQQSTPILGARCAGFNDFDNFGFVITYSSLPAETYTTIYNAKLDSNKDIATFMPYTRGNQKALSAMIQETFQSTGENVSEILRPLSDPTPTADGYSLRAWANFNDNALSKFNSGNINKEVILSKMRQVEKNEDLPVFATWIDTSIIAQSIASTIITQSPYPLQNITAPYSQAVMFYPISAKACGIGSSCDATNPLNPTCNLGYNDTNLPLYTTGCCDGFAAGEITGAYNPSKCAGIPVDFSEVTINTDALTPFTDSVTTDFIAKLVTSIKQTSGAVDGQNIIINPSINSDTTTTAWPFHYEINGVTYDPAKPIPIYETQLGTNKEIRLVPTANTELLAINLDSGTTALSEAYPTPFAAFLAPFGEDSQNAQALLEIKRDSRGNIIGFPNTTRKTINDTGFVFSKTKDGYTPRGFALTSDGISDTRKNTGPLANETGVINNIAIASTTTTLDSIATQIPRPADGASYTFQMAYAARCSANSVASCDQATAPETALCTMNVNGETGQVTYTNACCTEGYGLISK